MKMTIGKYVGKNGTYDKRCADKSFETSKDYEVKILNVNGSGLKDFDILMAGSLAEFKDATWVYSEDYGRYYFIIDKRIYRNNLVIMTLHEDVLTTKKEMLRKSKGTILRSENCYNMYLTDNRLPRSQQAVITTQKFPQTPFSGTFKDCGVIVGLLGAAKTDV